ncbi:MAG: hypothetical protein ABSF23_07905 [Terracidiphilus sp.]|jgi:hypothetical protein
MYRRFLNQGSGQSPQSSAKGNFKRWTMCAGAACALAVLLAAPSAAQVLTIDTNGKGPVAANGPVDRQYQQIAPTHVELSKTELDPKTRLLLIRALQSEQGFAMRPFPRGHKGLTLHANGKLEPAGEGYLNMVMNEGLSAKPGSRVVITDIKIDRSKIVFDLDGGPDAKHRFLSHIHITMGPTMGDPDIDPTLADHSGQPSGSRVTVAFADRVPELTADEVKALLAPLISFDVKSPIQAFTDTLPPALKDAILNHKVLVGMSTDMVLFAKGQPLTKSREMEGQMPFEEWVYGTPPQEVDFVRINGNRVIRVEIAKDGKPLQIFATDVVSPIMAASGAPKLAQSKTRIVHEGDVEIDPDRQAPAPAPSLRKPGEELPADQSGAGVMRPVHFPKQHPDDTPGANPDEQSSTPQASGQAKQAGSGQPSPQTGAPQPSGQTPQSSPANSSQPQSAPAKAPPAGGSQQPPAGSNQLVSSGHAAGQAE